MKSDLPLTKQRRCGFIALTGCPNVGKSTLFNRLIGAHLSPVTHKPQTTRYNIRGVLTQAYRQIIFVDTPGLHNSLRSSLNQILNKNVLRALNDVDMIIMMVVFNQWSIQDETLLKAIKFLDKPKFLVINKIDRERNKANLLRTIETFENRHLFDEIFPLSALRDKHFDRLVQTLGSYLPIGDFVFDESQLSDRSERFIAAELVREQLMFELHQELPYTLHVEIEHFEERKLMVYMLAVIYIDKASRRSIIIGRGGDRLKRVGTRARHDIERLLGRRVFLDLWVKTKSAWARDPDIIRSYSGNEEVS